MLCGNQHWLINAGETDTGRIVNGYWELLSGIAALGYYVTFRKITLILSVTDYAAVALPFAVFYILNMS